MINDIYGCAEVTLYALVSNACDEPFLIPRVPRLKVPFQSYIDSTIYGQYQIRLLPIDNIHERIQ